MTEKPSIPERPPFNLAIRAIRPEDYPALTVLVNLPGYRRGTLSLPYQSEADVRRRYENANPNTTAIVAVIADQIVGQATLARYTGRRSHVGSIVLGVHDDFVGRGIGNALLSELLAIADDWLGLVRLELTAFVDKAAAIALYKRHGFAVEGTHRAFAIRDGGYVDALMLARIRSPMQIERASP